MKKKYYLMTILFLGAFFLSCSVVCAHGKIVQELELNASEYIVRFSNAAGMISRDGSEAMPIMSGTKLVKPGTYFLTLTDSKGNIKISTFTLRGKKDTNVWTINRESELDEILKYTLENFKKEIVIKFNYENIDSNKLNTMFEKRIENLLNQYPKLTYEGYSIEGSVGRTATVKLKIIYPLQVVSTLKKYDINTNKKLLEIINENITSTMPDYKREIALFEYIIQNVTYSKTVSNGKTYVNATPMSHTIFGALINQLSVCDGHAKSLMYLLNAVGVPTKIIIGKGDVNATILHAWNLVKIQGNYYHVDSTMEGQNESRDYKIYDFFNEEDTYMKKAGYVWNEQLYPKADVHDYNMLYMPIQMPKVYRITNNSEIDSVLLSFYRSNPRSAIIIFYNDAANKWNEKFLASRIGNSIGKQILYRTQQKYDTLVIYFKEN